MRGRSVIFRFQLLLQSKSYFFSRMSGGKTAAFLLPVITGILRDNLMSSKFSEKQEPACLVISPTRELAIQTYIEAIKFSKGLFVGELLLAVSLSYLRVA